ncbi:MAG: purine-nucleoside phosphorylase [Desulfobacteraceae bacterium]|nr:purine-nucleoside phosphorylase [Desulfobacteraceae bacterium]
MQEIFEKFDINAAVEAAAFLRNRWEQTPTAAIFAGTGLGNLTAALHNHTAVAYGEIPHFPLSTVQSHAGQLVNGWLSDIPVVVLQGRFHLYEGYSPAAVTFPIRVLQSLGVSTLILTNAAGGLNPNFSSGDLMVISDHINLTGANPLVGLNETQWGPRFPDMTAAYDLGLRNIAFSAAPTLGIQIRQGVYVGLKGPSLETPAEMRFLRTFGADAVGFSTVMETIAAVHGGMRVLGLSTITNMCLPERLSPSSVDEIIAVAEAASPKLAALIAQVLKVENEQRQGKQP